MFCEYHSKKRVIYIIMKNKLKSPIKNQTIVYIFSIYNYSFLACQGTTDRWHWKVRFNFLLYNQSDQTQKYQGRKILQYYVSIIQKLSSTDNEIFRATFSNRNVFEVQGKPEDYMRDKKALKTEIIHHIVSESRIQTRG